MRILGAFLHLAIAGTAAYWIEWSSAKNQGRKTRALCAALPCLFTFLIYLRRPYVADAVQGLAFVLILFTAALQDVYRRKVDDSLSVMLVLTALISFQQDDIPLKLAGAVACSLPLLIAGMSPKEGMGGADIKLMAALGFFLGLHKGLAALFIGLGSGVVCVCICRKAKKRPINIPFPLVPYLAAGGCLAYILPI